MTRNSVLTALAVVFVVLTGVLVHVGRDPGTATAAGTPGSAPAAARPASGTTRPTAARRASRIPMRALAPGEKAPQFVIFSFDGAGDHQRWQEFMAAAKPTDSRFTGFLTGTYLLTDANAAEYTGPGHAPGRSSVGFGGSAGDLTTRIKDLNQAWAAGHEIGTHYNGHFCSGSEPSGEVWTTADWNTELGEFFSLFRNYRADNPEVKNLPALQVPVGSIKGGRTPCLEGQWDQLVPAWKKAGFTYDSSMNAETSGISWPRRTDGIWEFAMPYVYSPGFGGMVVNMDYNMWVKFNGGQDEPSTAPALRAKVLQTYEYLFQQTYTGNRAPLLVANHFNRWNGDSFNPSVLAFMKQTCGKKDVYCATYSEVVAWMQLQKPAVLAALQQQAPVALGPS